MSNGEFYVYVYIDPRNLQEFYYGKGKGDRKLAHLSDPEDSKKNQIVREIKRAGLEPIIKVIARDLIEHEAYEDLHALSATSSIFKVLQENRIF